MTGQAAEPTEPIVSSAAPGFLFVEGEPARVELRLAGPAKEGKARVELTDLDTGRVVVTETTLPRVARGNTFSFPIELPFPERGLYRLRVSGKSRQTFSFETMTALTFAPRAPNEASPWGIFYVPPIWFAPDTPEQADLAAASIRRLGAGWARLNFWAHAMEPVTVVDSPSGKIVTADFARWKRYAQALRREGVRIMGTVAQMPRALSAEPNNETPAGDGGPAYNRSKPADYALWEQLVEKMAAEFRDEIDAWEIWNEPDNQGVYWRGDPLEFADFAQHTAAALRRGNPRARIVGSGFTSSPAGRFFAEAAIGAGLGKALDVFSVHYTEGAPEEAARWRELLNKYHLDLPIWNTEERAALVVMDRAQGIQRTAKFLHVAIGYDDAGPLVNKDYSPRPAGLEFSVAARLIGPAKYLRTEPAGGGKLHLLQDGAEMIAVYQADSPVNANAAAGAPAPPRPADLQIWAEVAAGERLQVTTLHGKTREIPVGSGSLVAVPISEPVLILHGALRLRSAGSDLAAQTHPKVERPNPGASDEKKD